MRSLWTTNSSESNGTSEDHSITDGESTVEEMLGRYYRNSGSVALVFLLPIMSVVGFLGNMMMFKFNRQHENRGRGHYSKLMCVVSFIDGLVCVLVFPIQLVMDHVYFEDNSTGIWFCKIQNFVSSGLFLTSNLSLLVVSMDCYLSVSFSRFGRNCKRHIDKIHSTAILIALFIAGGLSVDTGFVRIKASKNDNVNFSQHNVQEVFSHKCLPTVNEEFAETNWNKCLTLTIYIIHITIAMATCAFFKVTLCYLKKIFSYAPTSQCEVQQQTSARPFIHEDVFYDTDRQDNAIPTVSENVSILMISKENDNLGMSVQCSKEQVHLPMKNDNTANVGQPDTIDKRTVCHGAKQNEPENACSTGHIHIKTNEESEVDIKHRHTSKEEGNCQCNPTEICSEELDLINMVQAQNTSESAPEASKMTVVIGQDHYISFSANQNRDQHLQDTHSANQNRGQASNQETASQVSRALILLLKLSVFHLVSFFLSFLVYLYLTNKETADVSRVLGKAYFLNSLINPIGFVTGDVAFRVNFCRLLKFY